MRASRNTALRAGAALLLAVAFAHGHDGAIGIVKQRMDAMSDMGKAGKSISAMLKGKRTLDAEAIRAQASAMGEHASQIPDLFPDTETSRHGGETEALPAVWQKRAEFEALAARLERQSAALADAAAAADEGQVAESFSAVRRTCRACHDEFREKKSRRRR